MKEQRKGKKILIYSNIEQLKKKAFVYTGLCEMEMREGTEGKCAVTLESLCNISERQREREQKKWPSESMAQ